MMVDLTEVELDIITKYRAGHGIVCHANVGLGIAFAPAEGDRISIEVDLTPIRPGHDGQALRDHMLNVVSLWTEQLSNKKASVN